MSIISQWEYPKNILQSEGIVRHPVRLISDLPPAYPYSGGVRQHSTLKSQLFNPVAGPLVGVPIMSAGALVGLPRYGAGISPLPSFGGGIAPLPPFGGAVVKTKSAKSILHDVKRKTLQL